MNIYLYMNPCKIDQLCNISWTGFRTCVKSLQTPFREIIRTDIAYHAIVKKGSAGIEFSGENKYALFVADLSVCVKRYSDIIVLRKGRNAAKNKQ